LGAPQHAGDFGLVTEGGMAWLVRALPPEDSGKKRPRGAAAAAAQAAAEAEMAEAEGAQDPHLRLNLHLNLQRLMPADALRVRGRHNAANALAALALATAIDCPLAPLLHGLREYTGEPHRLQFVAHLNGVTVYDDSKGTNVGATVAAISGLAADHEAGRLVLILGGDGKGQDFGPLAEPLRRHGRAVATLGRDAAAIEQAINSAGLPVQRFDDMAQAVQWCLTQARSGDALLLSPACSSLDMYRNYAHRAEVFVSAVQAHATEVGLV
jgi:UDP-N-acetylmuramoylalanine--D-glutamate ligase